MPSRLFLTALALFLGGTPAVAADCSYLLKRLIPLLEPQCGAGQYCPDLEAAKSEADQHCGTSFGSGRAKSGANTEDSTGPMQTPQPTTRKPSWWLPGESGSSFCDCSRRRGNCHADARFVDNGTRIEFTSNTAKCSFIGYYVDEHPGAITITDRVGYTDYLKNPLRKQQNRPDPKVRVDSCDICPRIGEP